MSPRMEFPTSPHTPWQRWCPRPSGGSWEEACQTEQTHPLAGKVTLVANKHLVHFVVGISINLIHPLLDIVERFLICHIVHNDDSMGSSVIRRGDSPESLLPCSVPNLKFHSLSIQLERADFLSSHNWITEKTCQFGEGNTQFHTHEINTDRADVALSVRVIGETKQQAGFANSRVSNKQELEQVIAIQKHR